MNLLSLSLIAFPLLANGLLGHQGTAFKRALPAGMTADYAVSMNMEAMQMKAGYTIHTVALKPTSDGLPQMSYEVTAKQSSSGDPGVTPEKIASKITAYGMLDDIKITMGQIDYVYLFLGTAGMTADKPVKVGDSFPVKWASAKMNLQVVGTGKVLEMDAKTIKVSLDLAMMIDDKAFGKFNWTSIDSATDFSLISSTGGWSMQGLEYKLGVAKAKP
jgi:hypothetical protein